MENIKQESQLNSLLTGLGSGLKSIRDVRGIYDEQVAFEFNSLNFFSPNENKVSEILAFLLNPNANHAQKETFLNLFLTYIDLTHLISENIVNVDVIREFRTSAGRRIDIVIKVETKAKEKFLIGIENKIYEWTQEQSNQLGHYAEELEKLSGERFLLLYLTPNANEASEHSISEEVATTLYNDKKMINISYSEDIISLFEKFELVCKAPNVRAFIKDFQHYLKQQYRGEKVMGEKTFIVDHIAKDPAHLETAFEILSSKKELQQRMLESFNNELTEFVQGKGNDLKVECCDSVNKLLYGSQYETLFKLNHTDWGDTCIVFQFQSKRGKNLIYGVPTRSNKEYFVSRKDELGYEKTSDAWAVYNHSVYSDWESSMKPWIAMIKPTDGESEFMKHVREIIEPLIKCISKCVANVN